MSPIRTIGSFETSASTAMSTSSKDAANDLVCLQNFMECLFNDQFEDEENSSQGHGSSGELNDVEFEAIMHLYILVVKTHLSVKRAKSTSSGHSTAKGQEFSVAESTMEQKDNAEKADGNSLEESASHDASKTTAGIQIFNALLTIAKEHDTTKYLEEAELVAVQDLLKTMKAPLRQNLRLMTTCKAYDRLRFPGRAHDEESLSDEKDASVTSDNVHDGESNSGDDGALEETRGSEVNELNEILESHSDISKERADKVDSDGNVHDDSDVMEENLIGTEVNKDEVAHTAEGDDDIHGEHDDFKEYDCITEVAVELNEILESHSDISKDHADKVDSDGNVHDDSEVMGENPIGTELKKDEVAHIAEGDDGIHDEHDDFKEQDCITEVAVDKDSVEVICDADDSKVAHTAEGDDGIHDELDDLKEQDCITEVSVDKDSVEVTCDVDDSKIN